MRAVTRDELVADLRRLGLREGDTVMLHSSLGSLGVVEGGAEAVVDAFSEATAPGGTLIVPAFRDDIWMGPYGLIDCVPQCPQALCPSQEPGLQGAIAEAVRQRCDSVRSCHPTHSWAAIGLAARDIVSDHHRSPTPCGSGNPFEKLVERGGCIVALGVGVNSITLFHYLEDILNVPYLGAFDPPRRHITYSPGGRRIQYEFPGVMEEVLRATGVMTVARVGRATTRFLRAKAFKQFLVTIFRDNPYCLVLRPPDRSSDNLLIDAFQKAVGMVNAWTREPKSMLAPVEWPEEHRSLVREDCPAFAGYEVVSSPPVGPKSGRNHSSESMRIPLCKANAPHPGLFHREGVFRQHGVADCSRCSWHQQFPRRHPP